MILLASFQLWFQYHCKMISGSCVGPELTRGLYRAFWSCPSTDQDCVLALTVYYKASTRSEHVTLLKLI